MITKLLTWKARSDKGSLMGTNFNPVCDTPAWLNAALNQIDRISQPAVCLFRKPLPIFASFGESASSGFTGQDTFSQSHLIGRSSEVMSALAEQRDKWQQVLGSPDAHIPEAFTYSRKILRRTIYRPSTAKPVSRRMDGMLVMNQTQGHTCSDQFRSLKFGLAPAASFACCEPYRSNGRAYGSYRGGNVPNVFVLALWDDMYACSDNQHRSGDTKQQFNGKPGFFHATSFPNGIVA